MTKMNYSNQSPESARPQDFVKPIVKYSAAEKLRFAIMHARQRREVMKRVREEGGKH